MLSLLLAILPSARIPVQDPTVEAFDERLTEVARLSERGDWESAKAALVEAVHENVEAPWILARIGEVRDKLRTCSFWSQYERPEPQDVLQGKLKTYKAATGKIDLRYEWDKGDSVPKHPQDFVAIDFDGKVWVHPAPFVGPYSVEVRGTGAGGKPHLYTCFVSATHFDSVDYNNTNASRMQRHRGGSVRSLDSCTDIFNSGRRYSFKVEVEEKRTRATILGKRSLDAERLKGDPWGRCGLRNFFGVREVILKGTVDPGWIDGLIDARVEAAWDEFLASYDPNSELPQPLQEALRSRRATLEDPKQVYPGGQDSDLSKSVERVWQLLEKQDPLAAEAHLLELGSDAPEAFRRWMSFWIEIARGNREGALAECDAVIELDPDFYWSHHVRANLRSSQQSMARTRAEAQALIHRFPSRAEAHGRLARLDLREGDLPAAEKVLEGAILAGISPDSLEDLRRTLIRAVEGPPWNRPHEWKGKHYLVRSDMGEDLCFDACKELERSYSRWNSHLRRVPRVKQTHRYPVFLFAGEAGYLAYAGDLMGSEPESTLGVYLPSIKQLLIWSGPDREQWMRTIRHEGFHQYLDQLAPTAPIWLHEGLAEYYETGHSARGRWVEGEVRVDHTTVLAQTGIVPLTRFLRLTPDGFMRNRRAHYAQAWAFVHFLLNGKQRGAKALFDIYLDTLVAGGGAEDGYQAAFADEDMVELETAFIEYLREL